MTTSLRLSCLAVTLIFLARSVQGAPASTDAAELYHDYCSVCHGDHGDGRSRARQGLIPPPRDFTAPGSAQELPRERIVHSILNGRPGTAMVAWKSRLSQAEAEALADYIATTFMQPIKPKSATLAQANSAPAPQDASAASRPPKGNAARGQALYMANCSTCHGTQGKGDGPRAYFIFPRPRDFTSTQAKEKLDPSTLFQAVKDGVQGREMPAWGKVLSAQQIADVSAFVTQRFLSSGNLR